MMFVVGVVVVAISSLSQVLTEFDDGNYDQFAVKFFRQNNFSSCKYFTLNADSTIKRVNGEGINVSSGLLKSGCNGRKFLLSNISGTITDAWRFCCSLGMTPAVISTLAEMTCLRDLFSNLAALEFYRVSATDLSLSRRFITAADTQVPVSLWARSEPDNYRGEEMCSAVHFAPYFGLYDVACFRSLKVLCGQLLPNKNGTLPVPSQGILLRCEGKTFFLSENIISVDQHLDSCCKMGGVPANIEWKSEMDCLQRQFMSLPADMRDERSTTKFYIGAYDSFLNRTFYMCPSQQVVPDEFWSEDEPNNGDFTQCFVSVDLGSELGLHDSGLVPQRYACQFGPNITFIKDVKQTVPEITTEKVATKKLAYNPNVYKLPMKDCKDFVCPKQIKDADMEQQDSKQSSSKGLFLKCDGKSFFLSRPEVSITINQIWPTCCKMGGIPARIESRSEIECLQKHFLSLPDDFKDARPSNKFFVSGYDIYLNRTFYMCPASKIVSDDLWARGEPNNSDRAQCLITLDLGKKYGLNDCGLFPQRYICQFAHRSSIHLGVYVTCVMAPGVNIVDLEPQLNSQLLRDFAGERTGFVQAGAVKCLMPVKYRQHSSEFLDFKLRPDDTWIVTFPRSGTLIMQEMLWLLANDLDYEKAAQIPVTSRVRFMEFGTLVHDEFAQEIMERVRGDAVRERKVEMLRSSRVPLIDAEKSPRVIKTHLPLCLLPPKLLDTCKVVYVARNPKDVAVSYFHLNRRDNVHAYQGDFPQFWNYFTRGLVVFGPHCEHVAEAWSHRNHPNMKFLFYENLITDMKSAIRDLASHMDKQIDREQIQRLSEHLSIESFRKNKSINDTSKVIDDLPGLENENEQEFIRKGKNHGWKEYFTPEMNVAADLWVQQNYGHIPDFAFPKP